jgi:hypothetical protein
MKILSVFSVSLLVLASLFFLTGCGEEEEEPLEDLFVEKEPEPEEIAVGPLPPHVIPEDAPVVVIEEISKKEMKRNDGFGYRLRVDHALEQDMVVQVREVTRDESNGREKFKSTFSLVIEKGKTTSMDMIGWRGKVAGKEGEEEEKWTLIATIIPLPNPFPKLPLVWKKYDYRPPRENDETLDLPDDYEFLLYNIGDQSRVEIEF